jgi:hypothetical protein
VLLVGYCVDDVLGVSEESAFELLFDYLDSAVGLEV